MSDLSQLSENNSSDFFGQTAQEDDDDVNTQLLAQASLPEEKCVGAKCSGYRGLQNKTESGRSCQNWSSQSPVKHTYL